VPEWRSHCIITSMDRASFERLVVDAIAELPKAFLDKLANVDIVVEDWPDPETVRLAGTHSRAHVLGFYRGIPQTDRTQGYVLVLPDKISIYQGPIELHSHTEEQMRALVKRVVRHELAHHFGIGEERLREIGV
jgi:predicted Zn-dependent protease with MMP-like domain